MQEGLGKITFAGNSVKLGDREYDKLSSFIRINYGINISSSKRVLLESRLQKRLGAVGVTDFAEYVKRICDEHQHQEIVNMINVISTNKTSFFRERSHFDFLAKQFLPEYAASIGKLRQLRVWSAASSSGEEVYTLAMVLEEFNRASGYTLSYCVEGSDVSTDVLNKGIQAVYDEGDVAIVPPELRQRYFLKGKNEYDTRVRVVKKLRERTKFRRFNLMSSEYPAKGTYDIIFCRNVLIYFDRQTQEKVIQRLCNSLSSNGYLFLGHSESIIGLNVPLEQVVHAGYRKISAMDNGYKYPSVNF